MVKRLGQTDRPFKCQNGKYDFFPFYQYYDIIIFLRKETISQVSVVVHMRLGFFVYFSLYVRIFYLHLITIGVFFF